MYGTKARFQSTFVNASYLKDYIHHDPEITSTAQAKLAPTTQDTSSVHDLATS